jgi:hypothetical protein
MAALRGKSESFVNFSGQLKTLELLWQHMITFVLLDYTVGPWSPTVLWFRRFGFFSLSARRFGLKRFDSVTFCFPICRSGFNICEMIVFEVLFSFAID